MAEDTRDEHGNGSGKPFFSFDNDSGTSSENRNDAGSIGGTIDPATIATGNASDDSTRSRRTRSDKGKPRGTRGAGTQKTSLDLNTVEWCLLGIHATLSAALKVPELELQKDEATTLAQGIANVAQHYPMVIDPKTQAWIALIMVAGGLYSTRFVAYNARVYAEKHEQATTQPPQPGQPVTYLRPA